MRAVFLLALIGSALSVTPFSADTTRVCGDNRVCQATGDLQAVCTGLGVCQCADTTNFKAVTQAGVTYATCVPFEETTAQSLERKLQVVITITFVDAVCDKIVELTNVVTAQMQTVLGTQTAISVASVCETNAAGVKQRMNFGVIADMTIGDLYSNAVINFEQNLLTALQATTSAADIGTTTADVSLNSLEGGKSICPPREGTVAFARRSSTSECWAISCDSLYEVNSELYCTLIYVPSSDDDLSGGDKAGIIIGVLGFVVIVILIVYCCFCKKEEDDDETSSSSSGKSEGGDAPDAEDK